MTVCGNSVNGLCSKCQYFKLCHNAVWDKSKKKPMTNEEYIHSVSGEELEHVLTMLIMKDRFFADKDFAYVNTRMKVHHWLKEKHDD